MNTTAQMCRARAEEAEWMSHTVAYEPDRERLRQEAASWREQAVRVEAHEAQWRSPPRPNAHHGVGRWFGGRS